ncbi:MAG: FG-GAP repeat protein [Phycisphaerales bacterium]|nr:MAG: FG-GAP repeat protein [Phycisphaerales bacterium]
MNGKSRKIDRRILNALLLAGVAFLLARPAPAWERTRLTASDGDEGDRFRSSVSISGVWGVLGASYGDKLADEPGELPVQDCGSAYVFRRDDNDTPSDPADDFWLQSEKLTASDATSNDESGRSVSIAGDVPISQDPDIAAVVPVVGARYREPWGGAAYVYTLLVDTKLSVIPNPAPSGEPIEFTVTNKGTVTIELPNSVWVIIKNSGGDVVFPGLVFPVVVPVPPGGSETCRWDQTDINGAQVAPGVYTVEVPYFAGASWYLLSSEFEIQAKGACCYLTDGTCTDGVLQADCQGPGQEWFGGMRCDEIDCPGPIPTVSQWGLLIMGLLLLTGLKIRFGGRRSAHA